MRPSTAETTPDDANYEFQIDNGILVVQYNDFQMDARRGRHGQGNGSTVSPSKFFFRYRNSRRNKQAIYLPVTLQKNRKTGVVSVLGVTDPRIVNY